MYLSIVPVVHHRIYMYRLDHRPLAGNIHVMIKLLEALDA